MKVKALKLFYNKLTKVDQHKGDVLEMDKERAVKSIERGLVEEVKTEKKEGKPKTSKKEKK